MNALQLSFLGYSIRLARPEYLFGLAAAALVLIFAVFCAIRRKRLLARYFQPATRERALPGVSTLRHGIRDTTVALALALFCLALTQPQCGTHSELAKRYGIDLVILIDASSSMLAKDIKPSRIARAKIELSELLDKLNGDRVGIVVFAGDAFVQCPLTSDYAAAKMFLAAVDPTSMPVQGTNIARALEESRNLLVDAERGAKARAMVLLTDGEDNSSSDVIKELDELKRLDIKLFALGIGSITGEPIPELDQHGAFTGWKKDQLGNTVMTRLDEAGLMSMVDKTGGRYIHSVSGDVGVQEVWRELDRLDKAEFESRLTVKYDERFQYLALPGLLLLVLGAAIRPANKRGRA